MPTVTQPKEEYDFIICGGGAAGCAVAGRLAEVPGISILVIEAGPHNDELENSQMPGGWVNLFNEVTEWNILSEVGINGRQVPLLRGKQLGGSSGCNATLCIRGTEQDFDDWQMEGWSGKEVFGYMRKAETFHPEPWFLSATEGDTRGLEFHGTDGPLHTSPHKLAPVSERVLSSMMTKGGFPFDADMFTHGQNPHGCGHAVRTIHDGVRSTAADYVVENNTWKVNGKGMVVEVPRVKGTIDVLVNSSVDKVLMEKKDNDVLNARAVQVIHKPTTADETPSTSIIGASKEIIISGGSYNSPNILQRSGLGRTDDLSPHGIKTLLELPGVGQNLMDHPIVWMSYEVTEDAGTNDRYVHWGEGKNYLDSAKIWKETREGVMGGIPFGPFAFARLDEQLKNSEIWNKAFEEGKKAQDAEQANGSGEGFEYRDPMGLLPSRQPNIELFTFESYVEFGLPPPIDGQHTLCTAPELFGAQSRGTVTLRDANGLSAPKVDHAYMTHPLDIEVLAEGCRMMNDIIMNGEGTKDIVKGTWPPLPAGEESTVKRWNEYSTTDEWRAFARDNATTCYHPGGTCVMGKADDPNAVVDEKLFVRGVSGLRVADCSIIPILPQGHTQMTAYAIGEKCADLVKETWGLKSIA